MPRLAKTQPKPFPVWPRQVGTQMSKSDLELVGISQVQGGLLQVWLKSICPISHPLQNTQQMHSHTLTSAKGIQWLHTQIYEDKCLWRKVIKLKYCFTLSSGYKAAELKNSQHLRLSTQTEPSSIPSWMEKGSVSFPLRFMPLQYRVPPTKRSPFLPLNFWSPSNLLWPKDNAKHDVYKSLQTSSMCVAMSCCIQSTKWKRRSSVTRKGDSRSPQTPVVTDDQPSVIHQIGGQDTKLPPDWCLHEGV